MIRLRTLGTLDLRDAEGVELRSILAQPKRLALLVCLAVGTPHGFHRRDRLLALFWPESETERARATLNRAIYFLRRELGEGVLLSRGDEEIGVNPERFWCDAAAFDDAYDRGDAVQCLELYRGDLLSGFFAEASGFEAWLEGERARLRGYASEAAWALSSDEEARGNVVQAARWAKQGAELAPFREVGIRRLLELLDRAGDRSGAALAYQDFAQRLAAELEVAPSPETKALVDAIRSRDHANGGAVPNGDGGDPKREHESNSSAQLPNVEQRPRRRHLALVGGAASIGVLVVAFGLTMAARDVDAPKVYVEHFANRTGDRANDVLGGMADDRVAQALSSAGLVVALPNEGEPSRSAKQRARAMTIVSGEYYHDGGRIRVQAWISDRRRNGPAWTVGPFSAPLDSVASVIEEVSSRVTGGVAAMMDEHFSSWFPMATAPPTFSAFQAFAEAVDLQSRGFDADAIPHLRRAVALDTTFTWAQMQLALAHLTLFESAIGDSIAREMNLKRDRLTVLQRHWLDWMRALKEEDRSAGYRAISAAAELAPERFLFNSAQWAYHLNRPREAIDRLTRLGPDSPHSGGAGAYWELMTRSYHALGNGRRELAAAREARRRHVEPMRALTLELIALAHLGRTREVRALLDTAFILARERDPAPMQVMVGIVRPATPAQLMVAAARELRAHGHEHVALEALGRALTWLRTQPASGVINEARQFEIAQALYLSRDWPGARAAFSALAGRDSGNFIYRGFLGVIAARTGEQATARAIDAQFEELRATLRRPHSEAGYWQSKIAAILGDERRAMAMLWDFAGGQGSHGAHFDFDYENISRSKDFLTFIQPKG
jgi:DNA-binding SARP family transcriptional activator